MAKKPSSGGGNKVTPKSKPKPSAVRKSNNFIGDARSSNSGKSKPTTTTSSGGPRKK